VSPFRFNAIIVGAFASLTLALALVGVYGVMTAVVGERTREYGIRVALGASRAREWRGASAGRRSDRRGDRGRSPARGWASRYVASLLYGVVPLDVTSYVLAAAVLMVCGLAAALGPSNHAGRVDPMVALRAE
jgi:putative ABC transport system permease protein